MYLREPLDWGIQLSLLKSPMLRPGPRARQGSVSGPQNNQIVRRHTPEQRRSFPPLCPDLLVELANPPRRHRAGGWRAIPRAEAGVGGDLGGLNACERFLDGLDAEASLVVPSISILEVFKWVLREHSEAWSWISIVDSRWPAASSVLPPEPVNHACTQCTAFFSTLTRQAKCRTGRSGCW
jgi:hypothetical protein